MDQIILFALLGLGTGALIAGIGLGIVLTYRGSGVINLATGAISMVAGYLFFTLNTGGFFGIELAVWPAAIVGLIMTLALGIACEYGVFRPLRNASPLAKLVASLGILLTAQASIVLIYGTAGRDAPGLLPHEHRRGGGCRHPRRSLLADGHRHRHRGDACGRCTSTRASAWPRARRPRARPTPCWRVCRRTGSRS